MWEPVKNQSEWGNNQKGGWIFFTSEEDQKGVVMVTLENVEVALYNHSEKIWEFCLLKPGKLREYRGHFQVETLIGGIIYFRGIT